MRAELKALLDRLAKQNNTSPKLGAIINVYQTTALVYAPLTLIGVASTIYGLWGDEYIKQILPWFTVWHMLGIMILIIPVLMVLFYKVVIPSMIAWSMQQQYKHRNPMAADHDEMKKTLEDVIANQGQLAKDIAKMATVKPESRYVQLLNPRTERYVKVDTILGCIVSHKKTSGPYANIPVKGFHPTAHRGSKSEGD